MYSFNGISSQAYRKKIFQSKIYSIGRNKKKILDHRLVSIDNNEMKQNFRITCHENFNQYLINTTLHGLRYVGDRSITLFERCFFGLMFLCVVLFSIYFITNVWIKWSASPMIITLSAFATPITNFPFPAVTICNMNQAQKSSVNNIRRYHSALDYSLVQSLCTQSFDDNITDTRPGKWSDFKRVLMKVSQKCSDLVVWCKFGGMEESCTELFDDILTDEGLCCMFNGLSQHFTMKNKYSQEQDFNSNDTIKARDWSPEKGYLPSDIKNSENVPPRTAIGTGNNLGLSILLNASINEYYCSSTNSYGFKLLLHSPCETPKIAYYGTAIANGYETRAVIMPTLSEASNSVRKVPQKVRQCLFESENNLIFYRTYSRRNCEMECETQIFQKNCNCVLYYMPRFHDDVTICGRKDYGCVNHVTQELRLKTNSSFMCECLPGCYAIAYETEISLSPLIGWSPLLKQTNGDVFNSAMLHIYYKDSSFRSQRKDELIGFTEFLSNTGGLLGLFMGFSMISISELFYFMTIRPYCNYLRISKNRQRTFRRLLNKFRNRFNVKSIKALKTVSQKNTNNSVFPYID